MVLAPTRWLGGRAVVPFVQAGFGFRSLDGRIYDAGTPRIYVLEGEVLSLGAGSRVYVSPAFAVTVQAWWSSGDFNDERVGQVTTHSRGIGAASWRVQTGLEWHKARAPR